MSGFYPSAPPQHDVFSSPPPSQTATASLFPPSPDHRRVATGPAWVPLTSSSQPRALDTVSERSDESRTRSSNGYTSDQPLRASQVDEMPFSLPATPPRSPDPASQPQVHDARPRSHRPAQLNLLDASLSNTRGGKAREQPPFFSLSAATSSTFNPVVGGASSSSGNTPTRPVNPRITHIRSDSREFASLPSTPLRSLDRFSASTSSTSGGLLAPPSAFSPPTNRVSWTWPPRSASAFLAQNDNGFDRGEAQHVQTTPTKRSRDSSAPAMLGEIGFSQPPPPSKELATRYVLVEGLERGSTEEDLRKLLVNRCHGLSLRGCFTSALRSHGIVVLVFNDVRHALAAVSFLTPGESDTLQRSSSEALLDARCISRETFEELHTGPGACPLLSHSEAVLVFTIRGPTSTGYFTPLPLLASFGEVRSLKVVEEHLQVVEYWDDRSAHTAREVLDGRESGGARFGCSFEPTVASIVLESTEALPLQLSPVAPNSLFPSTSSFRSAPPFTAVASSSTVSPGHLPFSPPMSPAYSPYGIASPPPIQQAQPLSPRDVNTFYAQQSMGPQGVLYIPSNSSHASPVPASPHSAAFFASPTTTFASSSPQASSPHCGTFPPSATSGSSRNKGKHRSKLSEEFGIVRDDKIPTGNVLNFERIEKGLDMRTTLMLKNIPNKLKDWEVMGFIDEVVGRSYDFFYLRCDYSNDCNVGYGFVNFTSTAPLLAFAKARLGTRWNMCGSDKLCIMSFANIQGKASLISHFKNSSVLDQEENRRPKLFVTSGPNAGEPEPFPACDDPIRKARSAANAQSVGLFPSHKPVFKVAQAFKGMHI
ncbi:hypothetical protein JCM6882_000720 [Rhodosporidiobolus microsporus]